MKNNNDLNTKLIENHIRFNDFVINADMQYKQYSNDDYLNTLKHKVNNFQSTIIETLDVNFGHKNRLKFSIESFIKNGEVCDVLSINGMDVISLKSVENSYEIIIGLVNDYITKCDEMLQSLKHYCDSIRVKNPLSNIQCISYDDSITIDRLFYGVMNHFFVDIMSDEDGLNLYYICSESTELMHDVKLFDTKDIKDFKKKYNQHCKNNKW